jgi:4-oxalmesaconate hydratase
VIVDCHGHYTTAPPQLGEYRDAQQAAIAADPRHVGEKGVIEISDDELRDSLEPNQLRLQRERGIDLAVFSPRASWMGHHIGNEHTSKFWTEHCNDLIRRICDLYPSNFAPVCQLPQSPADPEASIANSVRELRRCVDEMGFVGCNLNPDPSGGLWNGPTTYDRAFWPLYEAMCELDVPAMIHVSATCNEHFHSTGSHYLGADTTAFMQALTSGIFRDFPEMRWVIPHGGGAVPYHWGRFKGMAEEQGWQHLDELMPNVFFDTCVYHQPGIDLLVDVVPIENVLFASEMVGAVKGKNPDTGEYYDDTKKYVDRADLTAAQRALIFEGNVRRVYPRLAPILDAAVPEGGAP